MKEIMEEIKKETKKEKLNCLDIMLAILIGSMILTVGIVVVFAFKNHNATKQFTQSIAFAETQLENILAQKDTLHGADTIALNRIQDILNAKLPDQKDIIDTNNYVAIILTLITVCLTLATIIPYIVGKSVMMNQVVSMREEIESDMKKMYAKTESKDKEIKDKVESLFMSQKANVEEKYDKTMDKLKWAEGHLSRMIAYMLVPSDTKGRNGNKIKNTEKENPYWAIGWASKSMIRYLSFTARNSIGIKTPDIEKFCSQCMGYIQKSAKSISADNQRNRTTDDKDGIIRRAFTDMFDVLVIYNEVSIFPVNAIKDNIEEFENSLYEIYGILKTCGCYGDNEEAIMSKIADKSKYTEFLPEKTREDFILCLKDWLNKQQAKRQSATM